MNKGQWLAAEDPIPMLDFLGGGNPLRPQCPAPPPSPRKLRLFAAACAMLLPRRTAGLRRSVEAALAFADGEIGTPEMDAARWRAGTGGCTVCNPDAGEAAYYVVRDDSLTDRRAEMAALLRDVFGNPFRPVPFEPCRECAGGVVPTDRDDNTCPCCGGGGRRFPRRWLTPAVRGIARRAYDDRAAGGALDPVCLAVLADALEEAGCEGGDILGHFRAPCPYCRDADFATNDAGIPFFRPGRVAQNIRSRCACGGTGLAGHVRGCHVLDLVLGKG